MSYKEDFGWNKEDITSFDMVLMPGGDENEDTVDPDIEETPSEIG